MTDYEMESNPSYDDVNMLMARYGEMKELLNTYHELICQQCKNNGSDRYCHCEVCGIRRNKEERRIY